MKKLNDSDQNKKTMECLWQGNSKDIAAKTTGTILNSNNGTSAN